MDSNPTPYMIELFQKHLIETNIPENIQKTLYELVKSSDYDPKGRIKGLNVNSQTNINNYLKNNSYLEYLKNAMLTQARKNLPKRRQFLNSMNELLDIINGKVEVEANENMALNLLKKMKALKSMEFFDESHEDVKDKASKRLIEDDFNREVEEFINKFHKIPFVYPDIECIESEIKEEMSLMST